MYETFFGLIDKPFKVTPDTHYLYSAKQHDDVIKTLKYGIEAKKGFMLLTGEVGTGKTTSIRALMNQLSSNIPTSYILNPLVSTLELLESINNDFGCNNLGYSAKEQLDALNNFLIRNDKKGHNAVVIIDEAQNLSFEALEMTRLLSNLETETHKLLQVILVGQPELEEKLGDKSLRQLNQRIQLHCKLSPLNWHETAEYIRYRLQCASHRVASHNSNIVFDKSALKEIYKLSRGIPRIINTLCELALLAAFSHDLHTITKPLVKKAAKEVPVHVYYH